MASKKWIEDNQDKIKAYRRAWYERNKKKVRSANLEQETKNRLWIKELKNNSCCSRCDQNHPATLHFHHLDSRKKDFNISTAVRQGYSLKKIQEEIAKCIVLCANCHAILHYEEKNNLSVV